MLSLQRLSLTIVLGSALVSGAVAGVLSQRWGVSTDLADAGRRISDFPDRFGSWDCQANEPFDSEVVELLECVGSTSRTYRNRETGESVQVAFHVGPTGPTSVHTPDICFPSQNYSRQGERRRISVGAATRWGGSFWQSDFRSNGLRGETIEVLYGWTGGDRWAAADYPRFQFAGQPLLYKLQVVAATRGAETEKDGSRTTCQRFLNDLLPVLDAEVLKPEQG
ncbi:MAG TPA: exosortase-associated EpsI family protein [Pirellulales bacterium]|nr:exosortase-associated EpsI family protein [Pirellulales bacterium]